MVSLPFVLMLMKMKFNLKGWLRKPKNRAKVRSAIFKTGTQVKKGAKLGIKEYMKYVSDSKGKSKRKPKKNRVPKLTKYPSGKPVRKGLQQKFKKEYIKAEVKREIKKIVKPSALKRKVGF